MSKIVLKLDENLPNVLKELINNIYSNALKDNSKITVDDIENIIEESDDFDAVEILVELISKYLSLNKIKVIDENKEDESDDDDEEEDLND